jgi:hypothetical protein
LPADEPARLERTDGAFTQVGRREPSRLLASGFALQPAPAANPKKADAPVILQLQSGSLIYKAPFLSPAKMVSRNDLTLTLTAYNTATAPVSAMTLVENSVPISNSLPPVPSPPPTLTTVKLNTDLTAGRHVLLLRMVPDPTKPDLSGNSSPFEVIVPQDATALPTPQIVRAGNSSYVPAAPLAANSTIAVYGRYLKLEGTALLPGTTLEFGLFSTAGEADNRPILMNGFKPPDVNGSWQAELLLPQGMENSKGQIYVWAQRNGQYSAPSTPVAFEVHALDTLPAVSITAVTKDKKPAPQTAGVAYLNATDFSVIVGPAQGTSTGDNPLSNFEGQVLIFANEASEPVGRRTISSAEKSDKTALEIPVKLLADGKTLLRAAVAQDNNVGPRSAVTTVFVNSQGPHVLGVQPLNFATTPGKYALTVLFDRDHPIDPSTAIKKEYFTLKDSQGNPFAPNDNGTYDSSNNSITVTFSTLRPEVYTLTVHKEIIDLFGNNLQGVGNQSSTDYTINILNPIGSELASPFQGISGQSGPYVEFKEWLNPASPTNGFNPSDHVETRVARLYYFRDAHRVAQIINRDVKSYEYVAVAVRRRLADMARDVANRLTDERRAQEQQAVQSAQNARQAEHDLQAAQANLAAAQQTQAEAQQRANTTQAALTAPNLTDAQKQELLSGLSTVQAAAASSASAARAAADQVAALAAKVQALRQAEVQDNQGALAKTAQEDRAREEQFRREVAAAHEDPDTYAPGKPESDDPVRRCSISVIGEGEIQLRGPIKGLNIIRIMINQIDAPVGQVRVTIHSAQINGEHEDRMEKVANRIQKYIDHSRFLTAQSAQMLRKAVTVVASRKAEQAMAVCPPGSQSARDEKYLYAFFGQDFIQELIALDSEFLHTGNKLLSLHSMDSTSLSSALFLLALAKNSTRREILDEFERMTATDLPAAEMSFLEAAGFDRDCKKFPLLGGNARFQSLRGFFDAEVSGDDTMTPVQREFVRLAQIFKSRLVTELEYNQRVTERGIIEERFIGNYQQEVQNQKKREDAAAAALSEVLAAISAQRAIAYAALAEVNATISEMTRQVEGGVELAQRWGVENERATGEFATLFHRQLSDLLSRHPEIPNADRATILARARESYSLTTNHAAVCCMLLRWIPPTQAINEDLFQSNITRKSTVIKVRVREDVAGQCHWYFEPDHDVIWNQWVDDAIALGRALDVVVLTPEQHAELDRELRVVMGLHSMQRRYPEHGLTHLGDFYKAVSRVLGSLRQTGRDISTRAERLIRDLDRSDLSLLEIYQEWIELRDLIRTKVQHELSDRAEKLFQPVSERFVILLQLNMQERIKRQTAELSRRPLDHKKLLDMLIDDVEDKYIDLLEGTRAHTANIDNYIKSISTALDDDFQTQFYLPAFRGVREASSYWDVELGKVESTSILTNNRAFGKVTPEATMEFDLPKRDILISEALQGSLAMMQTYGALLQDPTFLALTKMNSGQPTSSPVQGAGSGLGLVRDVLPGLPSSSDERVLSQGGPGERRLAAPLEALIPDPAIYKFETGTGYEIRPVISPDGQSVVFHFFYLYTTDVREPVRADEKHLGRVKRHYIDTDVQLGNYELREISRYVVALKASRTGRGVPLFQDIPGIGVLFRPLPSAESSLQENVVMGQAVVFPTLFDLMGLRWAPAVVDLDPLRLRNQEFVVRSRLRDLKNHTFDYSASRVDEFLRIPPAERRPDLYRSQETIPYVHPDGYFGPGLNLRDSSMREGYDLLQFHPDSRFVPSASPEDLPRQPEDLGPMPRGPSFDPGRYNLPSYPIPGGPPGGLGLPPLQPGGLPSMPGQPYPETHPPTGPGPLGTELPTLLPHPRVAPQQPAASGTSTRGMYGPGTRVDRPLMPSSAGPDLSRQSGASSSWPTRSVAPPPVPDRSYDGTLPPPAPVPNR